MAVSMLGNSAEMSLGNDESLAETNVERRDNGEAEQTAASATGEAAAPAAKELATSPTPTPTPEPALAQTELEVVVAAGDGNGGNGFDTSAARTQASRAGKQKAPLHCDSVPTIKSYYRRVARVAVFGGLFSAVLHFSMSAFLFWYKGMLPQACEGSYGEIFNMLGLWHVVLGSICAVETFAIRELMDAMCHGTLARKHETEGRGSDFYEERCSSESHARSAMRLSTVPAVFYILAEVGLVVSSFWALYVTLGSNHECRRPKMILWLVLIVGLLSFGCSVYSGGSARYSYIRFVGAQ
eukprot:TRINITY_DN9947_c0_g1_i2.p1 TRINITY_DN9947_c0_g1~~TRINITY_DN9947_c0_g1_i2.p1  ORF type:complete len:297 (-),score=45.51 TRINITY_DN9947_c0_g1_i2:81-971(-)